MLHAIIEGLPLTEDLPPSMNQVQIFHSNFQPVWENKKVSRNPHEGTFETIAGGDIYHFFNGLLARNHATIVNCTERWKMCSRDVPRIAIKTIVLVRF